MVATKKRASRRTKTEKEKVELVEVDSQVVTIPAREILKRPRPKKPNFLNSRGDRRARGIEKMMSSWAEFVKVPLAYLNEDELERLLKAELSGRRRWAIVNRLHSAVCTKRTARERSLYRQECGLGEL